MLTIDLFEQGSRPVTVCFGRMNPPTLGHGQLLKTVADNAANGDYYIFATKTHKLPDNPLPYDVKFKFLQAMFPEYADHMVYNPELKTIMQVAEWLYNKGYTELNFVAGSDRIPEFERLLTTYNGKGQPGDKGYYVFTNISMISAGERDADAEGLAGISASKARAAAKAGNFKDFVAKTGAGKLAKPLYDAVRSAMDVSEDIASDSNQTASPIHGNSVEEDAAGVGVVATNSKMARDPRYSTSITKDVKPTTPKNMLRAFKLAEEAITEKWSQKQRKSVNCNSPKGFSQKAHCAGRKARQAGKITKSKPVTESKQAESASIPMIKKFLPIAKAELKLDKLPKIRIQRHVEVHDGQATFGRFVNGEDTIYVGIADRHPVDVLRTLAHELVHWRQFLDGRIKPGSGDTGSPIENEAHAIAGVLMRHFNKKYPNAIKLDNIELNESQDYVSRNINYSQTLNSVAWEGDELKPEVRDRLLKISGEFVKYLEVPDFEVLDVVLTGSMANYNWTKFSDFDLHVITNYSDLQCEDLAETFYRAKKELWNNYHNITIGGHEVEMYVEDSGKPPVSAGIFSILDNNWIKKPEYNKPEIDQSAVNAKVRDIIQQVQSAINSKDSTEDIQRVKDKLRKMRRAGLDSMGEFSVENLTYKILRNMGILNKMSDLQTKAQDQKLSLPESQKKNKFIKPGELQGSYTDSQLRALGFRQSENGSWYISYNQWQKLVADGKIKEDNTQLNEKKRRKKRKARLAGRPYYGYYLGLDAASDSGTEGGDGGMAESQDDETNNLPSINLARQNISRILAAAQRIYDEWDESDRDTYAGGGICHIIADAICDVMWNIGIECTTVSCSYEQHVYVAVKVEEGVYTIDIPYSIYETGGGFNWQKKPDIKFDTGDVVFYRVSGDPEEFENYTALEEGELIPWPKGTVKVDVSDVYDWYKLGQHISNLKGLGKHDFGKGPPQTVMAFGSEPLEHKYIKDLNKIGLKTYDIDEGVTKGSDTSKKIKISLKVNNEDSTVDVTAILDGKEVGHVNFDDSEGELIPQDLYVYPAYRGQGIAAAMYDYTKSKGYTILRGEEQSDDAIKLWNKHRPGQDVWEQGVAEGKQPGRPVVDAILKVMPVAQEIWFHGSRATGKHRRNSDIDILVVVPDNLVGDKYLGAVRILQKLNSQFENYDIQPTKTGTNIHRIAQEEGQLLWSKQGVAESFDYEREPLYHATLKAFEPSIMKSGLLPGGNLRMFDWSDSKYVYLSNYPDIARDFVDPGVIEPDQAHEEQIFKLMKQGGVILKIDQNKLNRQLLSADPHFNADEDDGAETYIYSGVIPPSAIIGKQYFNINESKQGVAENFADGRKPGRKGLAKRMGVPTKASVGRLRQIAKSSSGEKQRMAHWMANMKAGKRK